MNWALLGVIGVISWNEDGKKIGCHAIHNRGPTTLLWTE